MTSIEWLQSKMKIYGLSTAKKLEIVTLFEEAKFLHKQEIIDAFWNGDNTDCISEQNSKKFAEQYYNETFKKELTSQLPGINVNDVKPSNPQMIKENFSPKQK